MPYGLRFPTVKLVFTVDGEGQPCSLVAISTHNNVPLFVRNGNTLLSQHPNPLEYRADT